jgi:GT2 family glycosyltransferase
MKQKSRHHPAAAPDGEASGIYCHIDLLGPEGLHGWALDRQNPAVSVLLDIVVDGEEIGQVLCDGIRPDVEAAQIGPSHVGLSFPLPDWLADGQPHDLAIRDPFQRIIGLVRSGQTYHSLVFKLDYVPRVVSCVDGLRNGGIEGWVLRNLPGAPALQGSATLRIEWNGITVGHTRADRARLDVAQAHDAPAGCGFRFVPPDATRVPGATIFRLFLMPENIELGGSPVTVRFASNADEEQLLEIVQTADRLEREAAQLRRNVRYLLPAPIYGLDQYDEWFPLYIADLRRRVAAGRMPGREQPLVSVVCPIYRPALVHFDAAVRSVLAQTYANWELILVDDCSNDPALTASIEAFAAEDTRVRIATRRRNGGISEATNTAIKAAKGAWVALFDHDDLLVDVALEAMVAALRPETRLAYSDEDKVEESGRHVEPALKPDWNHRYLLGTNYVCHLTMLRQDLLQRVGPLRKAYDGAQDHDLLLRAAEALQPEEILHVPEILYHWRKTPQSTASSGSNKGYAAAAGAKAVSDHLARIGRPADVTPISGMTLYSQAWLTTTEPTVTIIVPYKDQIATTMRCLEALDRNTAYRNWQLVLVDNWSTDADAPDFAAQAAKRRRTQVLRVEEPFNFSRLNNLAVKTAPAAYYVFLNNDLFVTDPDWLRAAVNEALVDDRVGIVGGKFLYPNGTVQHAGVVLGAGGIAGHSFMGIPADAGGYCGRALVAQELTAVTAAGMLVRAKAFDAVGGFDEAALTVAFNDVDLCLRVRQAGYRVIMTPAFAGEHHESLSRGLDKHQLDETRFFHEIETMRERWGTLLEADPAYSRHFALVAQTYTELVTPKRAERRTG